MTGVSSDLMGSLFWRVRALPGLRQSPLNDVRSHGTPFALGQAQFPGRGAQRDDESWGTVAFYSRLFPFLTNVGPGVPQLGCLISQESFCVAVTLPSTSHPELGGDQPPLMTLPLSPTFAPRALMKPR